MRLARLLFLVPALCAAAPAPPALEPWTAEDAKALKAKQLIPGASLLGRDPGVPGLPDPGLAGTPPPPPSEIAGDATAGSRDVPEPFLDAYFASRPQSFLVDPQGLLNSRDKKEREEFLRYHSGDSRIDLFIYLFGPDQEIPGAVRAEELAERFFATGKPAVVVFYFLGAPERCEVLVSPSLADEVSGAEQRTSLATSLSQAQEKSDPLVQLQAFCVQMSIRLYWMEREAGLAPAGQTDLPELPEPTATHVPPRHSELKERAREMASLWGAPAGAGVGCVLVLAGAFRFWQSRRTYRFPDFGIPPRLGGDHAAGIGEVMSFGSRSVSPLGRKPEPADSLGGV